MELTRSDEHVLVIDDFLSPTEFEGVYRFVQAQRYRRVHDDGWQTVWALHDGEPWGSDAVYAGGPLPRGRVAAVPLHPYPTGTGVDRLIEEIALQAGRLEPWIGSQGRDWAGFSARAFLYPVGVGLDWHQDRASSSGAFAYYAHPRWHSQWGGELLVSHHDGHADAGLGDYIAPRPNRLVIVGAGALHRINPVHPAAGSHVRCSIAGFFVRPEALERANATHGHDPAAQAIAPDTEGMLRMLGGHAVTQSLHVAAELGIADLLAGGPREVGALARESGADPDALYRLLRMLAAHRVFEELDGRRFRQTPLSATLRRDQPEGLRAMALLGGHPAHWGAWGGLLHAVRSGGSAFEAVHGQGFFDAAAQDPTLGQAFHDVLTRLSGLDEAVAAALPLPDGARVIDVGGGGGGLVARLAVRHPGCRFAVLDRPEVLASAQLPAEVEALPGDFFEPIPGADVLLLKLVLHDWPDDEAGRLLSRCREALPADGRLFVAELLMPTDGRLTSAQGHDVNMLVLTGGRERSLAELEALLSQAGFERVGATETPGGLGVIEASVGPAPGAAPASPGVTSS